jgi:Uma2 family endonuclease
MMAPTSARILRRRRFDVDELTRMASAGVFADDERLELIDGELVEMPPQPGPRHSAEVAALARLFWERCGRRCLVRTQNPLQLDRHNLLLPDLALLRPHADGYRSRYPGPADTLLVVEVADTTLARDRGPKLAVYARLGIRQVWILELRRRRVHAFASPTPKGYASARLCAGDVPLPIPEDGEIAASALFG